MNMKQSYSIDFEDPPLYLRSTFHLTLWWVNPVVRKVLMTSPWPNKLRQGKYPHFCLFKGFCQYFETDGELEDHYQVHPNHRLTKQDHDGFRRNAELVKYFRTWNFPRFEEMPLNQCKEYIHKHKPITFNISIRFFFLFKLGDHCGMKMNSQAMLYHISRLHEVCEEFVLGPEPSH